jgi:hypothetical protein
MLHGTPPRADARNGKVQWQHMQFFRLMLKASQTDLTDSPITADE